MASGLLATRRTLFHKTLHPEAPFTSGLMEPICRVPAGMCTRDPSWADFLNVPFKTPFKNLNSDYTEKHREWHDEPNRPSLSQQLSADGLSCPPSPPATCSSQTPHQLRQTQTSRYLQRTRTREHIQNEGMRRSTLSLQTP